MAKGVERLSNISRVARFELTTEAKHPPKKMGRGGFRSSWRRNRRSKGLLQLSLERLLEPKLPVSQETFTRNDDSDQDQAA